MTIFTEITPNPATLKFVVSTQVFMPKGSLDFPDAASVAGQSGLAEKLFEFRFVNGVMIGFNYLTVTKDPAFKWEEVIPQVKSLMKDWLESKQPVVNVIFEELEADSNDSEDSEIVKRIKTLLEENVRPAVAMDGGDILFHGFEDGIVKLKLQGSCSGCPSSTMTLKMGIQGLLTRFIPEVKSVEAV